MVMYSPLYGYMDIGMLMDLDTMDMLWYVEEDFETLVVSGMVFGTLKCGVFDVLDILKNLRILDQEFSNKPIIGR